MRRFTLASLATALSLGLLAATPSIAQTTQPPGPGKMAPTSKMAPAEKMARQNEVSPPLGAEGG